MVKNTINFLAMGNFLIGIFVIGLVTKLNLDIFLTIIGFIGGIILTVVEGKFLFDKLW